MTKVAFITDTHFGVRNDNAQFYEFFGQFYANIFFPMIEQEGVEKIVHLGDVVDRRKYINFLTSQHLRKQFIEPVQDLGIPMDIICGNHDTYFKNTNDVNAFNELLHSYNNIEAYTSAAEVDLNGVKALYLPWIVKDTLEPTIDLIQRSNASIALGHLEIAGFVMHAGHVMDRSGLSPELFDKFDMTCSGHFHHRSHRGNIHYLGSPYEMSWSDYGNQKGFYIFDTETRNMEFFPNPYSMFHRVTFDGVNDPELDFNSINQKYIKFVIQGAAKQSVIDGWVEQIEKMDPYEIRIVDESTLLTEDTDDITAEELQDTLTIVSRYVDSLDTAVSKDAIKGKIFELYRTAMTVE